MRVLWFAVALFLPHLAVAERMTAFRAFALVPKEASSRLARIAACEGTPQPERWHIIVHDPQSDSGLTDYVVADGQIAARNGVSQFVQEVTPADVLPPHSVRFDSDRVAEVAQRYAAASGSSVASLEYELRKDAVGQLPAWRVTCLDAEGHAIGWVVIDAMNGVVLAMDGFRRLPVPVATALQGEPLVTRAEPLTGATGGGFREPEPEPVAEEIAKPTPKKKTVRKIEVRRAEPIRFPDPVRTVRRIFPF